MTCFYNVDAVILVGVGIVGSLIEQLLARAESISSCMFASRRA